MNNKPTRLGAVLLLALAPFAFAQTFTRITIGAIVNDGGSSVGCAWGDFDADGDMDLFVANFGGNNFLYKNNGDGTFTRITTGEIVNDGGDSQGASWGDFDNDGDLDLFVANFDRNNFLYANNGEGSFAKITSGVLVNDGGSSRGCSWADYDDDGDLDLFVANAFGRNNFLYTNNGDGTFRKVLTSIVSSDGGDSWSGAWGDYDADGDVDLFVTNANGNNALYRNNGAGSFEKITQSVVANDAGNSRGGSWGDFDNDGDLDLFVANVGENNFLYANNGDGTFGKITAGVIANDGGASISGNWSDFDNDGDLDLFVANSSTNSFLYTNDGHGSFTKVTTGGMVNDGGDSWSGSWGDYDNDGDLDLFVSNLGLAGDENNFLYRNNGNGNHWINIHCHGTISNASAIGARFRVKAKINNTPVWQTGEISAQTGFASQNSLNVEFGLGEATNIDSILIAWPSGIEQILTNVPADQFLSITEPNTAPSAITLDATKITTTTATLQGTVDPNNLETGVFFEWGETPKYGNIISAIESPITGSGNTPISADLTNLSPNTVYHFRVIAINSSATTHGADLAFATLPQVASDTTFTLITNDIITGEISYSKGCAWGDIDNDGDLDLFVTDSGRNNLLYLNNGDGSFTKITTDIVTNDAGFSKSGTWGDFDNDGYLDLFVANGSSREENNFLYRNTGGGSFTKISNSIVAMDGGISESSSWVDYDHDGDLDLFVANIQADFKNFLYLNAGNGHFMRVTEGDLVVELANSPGASWADYDNDGDADLFVTNSDTRGNNSLYQNNGRGSFTKITIGALVNVASNSNGGSWGDYDNDGDLDLFVANGSGRDNMLFENNGAGNFTQITTGVVVNDGGWSAGSGWGDFDNDGDLDLFVANGNRSNDFLYQNNGDKTFTRVTSGDIAVGTGNSEGCSWGDYDNDGDLDLFVSDFGGNNRLYRNNGNTNNWLNLRLVGTATNSTAIGARVKVKAVIDDTPRWQMREISGQTGYVSQNSLNVEFGLGDATSVDSVIISWPSGIVQYLSRVAVNQFLTVTEEIPPGFIHANFTADTLEGNPGLIVRFTDLSASNPPITSWQWDFESDGVVDSRQQNPSHAYSKPGLYTVQLTVANGMNADTLAWSGLIFIRQFTRVTEGNIVTDVGVSSGSSWADFDNDGDLDLFVANSRTNFLYANNGDGSFTSIATGAIVNDNANSYGTTWGDFDNDGDPDLFVANGGTFSQNNALYINDGDGSFTKSTTGTLVSDHSASNDCSWADYDNDGDLDLFVANRNNNLLYENNGDGSFTPLVAGNVVNDEGTSNGCAWGDYDNDGDLDLFVANGVNDNNFLYENNGDGSFTKIIDNIIVKDSGASTGASWGDYNNDGFLDLFVTNSNFNVAEKNFLYRNNGDGGFTKITQGAIVNDVELSRSSSWGDYDNDGDLDLFVVNSGGNNSLYMNSGEGSFTRITTGAIVQDGGASESGVWSDYDNDGDLDLFVANGGNNFLYRNNGNQNNWINIRLAGAASNASAIGAKVGVKATIKGSPSWQWREISANSGRFGQNSLNAEFGLGDAAIIDSLRIEWPSGIVQDIPGLGLNQFLFIQEEIPIGFIRARITADITEGFAPLTVHFSDRSLATPQISSWQWDFDADGVIDSREQNPSHIYGDPGYYSIRLIVANNQRADTLTRVDFIFINQFRQITSGALVTDIGNSNGSSWGDYDQDGDLDVFITTAGFSSEKNLLYENNGEGFFTRVTTGAIANDGAVSLSGTWGDYDNDGDLDFFVANASGRDFLYANNGDGSFTSITSGIILDDLIISNGASWGDYDNDGDLDLYVLKNDENVLYQNSGDGRFVKILAGIVVNEDLFSNGCNWADYDNDGDLDLFVANSGTNNSLYQNNGDGSFSKIVTGEIVNTGGGSQGASWGDYDNDGDLDLFVANPAQNFLFENNGDGSFTKITEGDIVNDVANSRGSSWGDYDNDGDLDLFVANDGESSFLYQNEGAPAGGGRAHFKKIMAGELSRVTGSSRSTTWADMDNDGDLDLLIANSGADRRFLFQNLGNRNNWINIQLTGTVSNTAAIGAKVHVKAAIQRKPVWQMREISAQTGFAGQNSLNAEFGLGDATKIDSIRIEWPNGYSQDLVEIEANQFLSIIEEVPHSHIQANFVADATEGLAPLTVNFSDKSQSILPITSWKWDFDNDGKIDSNERMPSYTYARPGIYAVRLIVTNSQSADTLTRAELIFVRRFIKVTGAEIVSIADNSRGHSWGDYDGDGDQDLFVANLGNNALYQNAGNGNFIRITNGDIVNDDARSFGGSWGDFDNDGDLDLFVASNGFPGENNLLFQNNGDPNRLGQINFTRIFDDPVANDGSRSTTGSWADFDNDGDLDLFVTTNANNLLYRNNGDAGFTKVLTGAVVNDGGVSQGSSWGDYDGDGDLDLFVANTRSLGIGNFLYANNGDGSFTKITTGSVVNDIEESEGGSWGDYDNDGDLDLFVTNFQESNSLYQNNGDGSFTKMREGEIVNDVARTYASSWGDFDNDGDLDLLVANLNGNNLLYENQGDPAGTGQIHFSKITNGILVNDKNASVGASWCDIDNDGDLDLFTSNGDGNRSNSLYLNHSAGSNWIRIHLTGTLSNRAAIGAKVFVKAVINDKAVWQMRELSGQTGYLTQNPLDAHFGLGDATGIDSIKIEWPSGIVQNLVNANVNQLLTMTEEAARDFIRAGFTADTTLGDPPLTVVFTDRSLANSPINSWQWDFDADGQIDSREQNPTFIYEEPGVFTVSLIASNGANADTLIRTDFIVIDQFRKITRGDIVADGGESQGGSWGDFDNDGDLDLYVTNGPLSFQGTNFLYRNNGDASFTRITTGEIYSAQGKSHGSNWGDYDNDGDLDIFVANHGIDFLFQNNGNSALGGHAGFTRITNSVLVRENATSHGCSWVDYDNDGDLDLYVANDRKNFLYQNSGGFTKVTVGDIVDDEASSRSCSWGDYDNDGDLDLYVANSSSLLGGDNSNFLYKNNGDGSFTRVISGQIVIDSGNSYSSNWGDYDNDGDLDLFVTNFNQSNFLYENTGDGGFARITHGVVATDAGRSLGSSWVDYDNDGDLDLFVINQNENNFLYDNDGAGNFTKMTNGDFIRDEGAMQSCTWGDFDNDGDLDLFVTHTNDNNFLYQNNGNKNNWINLHLIGTVSNASAIGAKVRIQAMINDRPVWQMQEIAGQGGYLSQNSLNVEFGLGTATVIDSMIIEWPSGIRQDRTAIAANQFLTIQEPEPLTRVTAGEIGSDAGEAFGASWGDYDGDGDLDLFVAKHGENALYRNDGQGSFSNVTSVALITDGGLSNSGSWGDYDRDGDLDLFLANEDNNFLYENNGDGSFARIENSVVVTDAGASRGCSWGDFDNDGDLDLFVANQGDNFLYENRVPLGEGFVKITSGPIVSDGGDSYGCNWIDFEGDGDLDLFVANIGDNFLYENRGDSEGPAQDRFIKIMSGAVVTDGGLSRGGSWGDYDNDGDLDLFVTNDDGGNFLYQNNTPQAPGFTRITAGAVVNDSADSRGSSWGDFDNDGDLDLFVANEGENNFLFENNGDGSFTQISNGKIVTDGGDSRGCSWADHDQDGDLDLFVANSGTGFLYQNNGSRNHWINLRLRGTVSNPSALGAKVRLKADISGSGQAEWQIRELSAQSGYASQNGAQAEFGLGRATRIDSIEIKWGSGLSNVFTDIAADQILALRENHRPRFANQIPDVNLTKEHPKFVLDLNTDPIAFTDRDGDTLTYAANSNEGAIVTASISNSTLTIYLVSDTTRGRAQIELTANDGRVRSDTMRFSVNRPPIVLQNIPDQTIILRDSSFRLTVMDVNEVFLDPDDDAPSYSVTTSDSTIAIATLLGSALSVSPGDSSGETIITVNAADGRGGTASTSFIVENVTRNRPPRLTNVTISDQFLIIGTPPFRQDLSSVFIDDDGDVLIYTAQSSDLSAAIATISQDTLAVVPREAGQTIITARANDGKGGEVATSFGVTVALSQPPQIAHIPAAGSQPLSTPIVVTATITDDEGALSKVLLNYRIAGQPIFELRDMQIEKVDSTTLRAAGEIPREAVTDQGVEYKIEATDIHAVPSSDPSKGFYSVRVHVPTGVSHTLPGGEEENSYHLFSVPLDLDDKSPAAVLRDLGPPDIKKWRFYELAADTASEAYSYIQYPNTDSLRPGKAFWLIVKNSINLNTGGGTTLLTSERYPIALHRGWNFVGNPFNFEAAAEDTMSGAAALDFYAREFGKDWSDPQPTNAIVLQPFSGYAVHAPTSRTLFINPHRFESGELLAKQEIEADERLWSIRILAQCQQSQDRNNVAAVVKSASQAWDTEDHPDPPVIGEYVSVYFPHRDWNTLAKTYCIDARPEPTNGDIWEFELKTNLRDRVNLTFEGIDEVPKEFEVWLMDDALNITQNLREQGQYAVAGAGPVAVAGAVAGTEHVKHLKLVVGKREFVEEKLAEARAIPTTYELSQNFPNPFNPATTIRYGLPKAERVTLKIYNLLGAEVATLVDNEQKDAGYHAAIWDGRDKNGRVVASGVYVYRMQAGNFISTKKLALVK